MTSLHNLQNLQESGAASTPANLTVPNPSYQNETFVKSHLKRAKEPGVRWLTGLSGEDQGRHEAAVTEQEEGADNAAAFTLLPDQHLMHEIRRFCRGGGDKRPTRRCESHIYLLLLTGRAQTSGTNLTDNKNWKWVTPMYTHLTFTISASWTAGIGKSTHPYWNVNLLLRK